MKSVVCLNKQLTTCRKRFGWCLSCMSTDETAALLAIRPETVKTLGQQPSDKKAATKLRKLNGGLSYRLIARNVGLSKNTVMEIVRRKAA